MSNQPQRIQRKRTPGFNLQAVSIALNGLPAKSVTRPGPFGNPYKVGSRAIHPDTGESVVVTMDNCLDLFERYVRYRLAANMGWLDPLRGKNIACFCDLLSLCHADVLLKIIEETE